MIERLRKTVPSLSLSARVRGALRLRPWIGAAALVGVLAGCGPSFIEIPIETPVAPKLDISRFQQVYIAGFLAGANEDVDANTETVRLLRSQLRNRNLLRVVDADAVPLAERALQDAPLPETNADSPDAQEAADAVAAGQLPPVKDEQELAQYTKLFSDTEFWKQVGEEHQQPLIVTGSILFVPQSRSGVVQSEKEDYDAFGRRTVVPVRTFMERTGYVLRPTFVFIDGRTGEQLYTESFREEVLYNVNQQTPALSSYFELMDRLLPAFMNTLSAQKIRGARVLLK